MALAAGKYGYFGDEQDTYVITDWRTPRPWINVISNGRYGVTISQTGGGYSWLEHSMLNRLTRWNQDILQDNYGKYLFLRDHDSGKAWSLTPQPLKPEYQSFRCIHGLGFTTFEATFAGIRTEFTIFVPRDLDCEVWQIRVENQRDQPARLSLFSYLEPLLGVFPDWHREFHKTFIRTTRDEECNAIIAEKTLWTAPLAEDPGWNKSWDNHAFFFADRTPTAWECDRSRFTGSYNSLSEAQILQGGNLSNRTGTGFDPIISYQFDLELAPGETTGIVCSLGALKNERMQSDFPDLVRKVCQESEQLLAEVKNHWQELTGRLTVDTPDPALNVMINHWLKYQTISCRLDGRTAYYQCGGAFGYRDQLQDSLIYLTLNPEKTRRQILLHAAHQQRDGTVQHWWHPVSGEGRLTDISDDLLWLPFVTFKYLTETDRYDLLEEQVPFLDDTDQTPADNDSGTRLFIHLQKAIDKALERRSERGLSLMGEGDWNDGMNGVGPKWRGESVWLSHFLFGILEQFATLCEKTGQPQTLADHYHQEAATLRTSILTHGWDKDWFIRATTDQGDTLGSADNREGKIFLNAQTWAVINGLVDQTKAAELMHQVEKHLYQDYGVLLFTPAFSKVNKDIGYLTRYAPGVRENGGVYSHAAQWAMIAQAMAGRTEKVYETFVRLCPPHLSNNDPDRYKGEPYVTAGNVEGPESVNEGQGAWTWYTGSAAWLYNVTIEYLLGVRVENNQLVVKPNLPAHWPGFTMTRKFRGKTWRIAVTRDADCSETDGYRIQMTEQDDAS